MNQLREVVEEITDAGQTYHYGLEAGSKPELFAALAYHKDPESLIVWAGSALARCQAWSGTATP